MTAYIEYVFLENFLLDGLLLYGAGLFTKTRIGKLRLMFSATLGGVYALFTPLIVLPATIENALTFCVGLLLSLTAFGRIKTKSEWGRYAFFAFAFFVFAGMVAGFILAVWDTITQKPPFILVLILMAVCVGLGQAFAYVCRQKCRVHNAYQNVYIVGEKRVFARGFLDSGNLAQKDGVPICFVCPLTFYKAFGDMQEGEPFTIRTMAGERTITLYLGELILEKNNAPKRVYFAPMTNMVFREYEMILPARILED